MLWCEFHHSTSYPYTIDWIADTLFCLYVENDSAVKQTPSWQIKQFHREIVLKVENDLPHREAILRVTNKELQKLSRRELLEILLAQSKELDWLKARVQELEDTLSSREIEIEKAGSIAEASLRLNGVFEAAQRAADQYLENIRRRNIEAENQCLQILAQTRAKCDQILLRYEGQTQGPEDQS